MHSSYTRVPRLAPELRGRYLAVSSMSDQWRLIWLVGLATFMIGIVTMTAGYHSVDEVAMVTAAVNMVNEGIPHANQLGQALWSIRPGEEVVMLGEDGNVYTKKSPLMVLLLSVPAAVSQASSIVSVERATLLLGPLALATTAVLFVLLATKINFSRPTGLVGVILLVIGTMLWPYAQTVFGEWLAVIGVLVCLVGWVKVTEKSGRTSGGLLIGVGAAMCVGANVAYAILAAFWGFVLLWHLWRSNPADRAAITRVLLAFAAPLVVLGAGLLLYNQVRFGNPLSTGYRLTPGQEGFTTPLWWGTLGLVLSPARGLIWYAPPVVLALFGAHAFSKRDQPLSGVILVIVVFHLVTFGLWWEWWGGYGWGPRFLLPTIAPLLLVGLEVVARAEEGQRPAQILVIVVLAAGIFVQLAGLQINSNAYEQLLDATRPAPVDDFLWYHHDPALVWDPAASPIVWHWQQILSGGEPSQLGWWNADDDPAADLIAAVGGAGQEGDVILSLVPELQATLLNTARSIPPVYGLPINLSSEDQLAQTLLSNGVADAQRVWLLTWYGAGDPANFYEAQLRQSLGSMRDEWHGPYRAVLLSRPAAEFVSRPVSAVEFGPITLKELEVAFNDDQISVQVEWLSSEALPPNLVSYIHVLDHAGAVVVQQDRAPLGGYAPSESWATGEAIVDQFAFELPAGVNPAELRLRLGWYRWPELEPLGEPLEIPVK